MDEDFEVPAHLFEKYRSGGFKSADAFIAAYAEFVGAKALITENREDFIDRYRDSPTLFPFKVWDAETALKRL